MYIYIYIYTLDMRLSAGIFRREKIVQHKEPFFFHLFLFIRKFANRRA